MLKIALVTGFTGGLGESIVIRLIQKGYFIIGFYSSNEKAAKRIEKEYQGKVVPYKVNFLDYDKFILSTNEILAHYKKIDVLVNNAGFNSDTFLTSMKDSEWDNVIQVNLLCSIYLGIKCLEKMKINAYGRIINISSISGQYGRIGQANYAATKGGLSGLTKLLQNSISYDDDILVNTVSPGMIKTNMIDTLPDKTLDKFLVNCVSKKVGESEDIGYFISCLVDNNNRYTHGTNIEINGGFLR